MRKGHRPDTLLAEVLSALGSDDPRARWHACVSLVARGPLIASAALADLLNRKLDSERPALAPADAFNICAELLQFIRRLLQQHNQGRWSEGIEIYGRFTYSALAAGPKVAIAIEGDLRAVIVQQFVSLLQEVGVANVRRCAAPDCPNVFVRFHKREYCSRVCARRVYMRTRRENERQARERRARRYRQQRTRQGSRR